jgi:hypothetical protein
MSSSSRNTALPCDDPPDYSPRDDPPDYYTIAGTGPGHLELLQALYSIDLVSPNGNTNPSTLASPCWDPEPSLENTTTAAELASTVVDQDSQNNSLALLKDKLAEFKAGQKSLKRYIKYIEYTPDNKKPGEAMQRIQTDFENMTV